jgi:hypothetical protein
VNTIARSKHRGSLAAALLLALACNGGDDPTPAAESTSGDASASTPADSEGDTRGESTSPDGSSGAPASTGSSGEATSTSTGDDGTSSDGSSSGSTGEPEGPPPSDRLFNHDGIARIDLTFDALASESLWNDPSAYVHADAQIELADGEVLVLPDIGLRLKGRYGSFRSLDGKSAFLLRFDEWTSDQEPLGLEKLALNNMVQDPSMIHEQLAYMLMRDAGVPAPRSGYARVFVNGELYGLYATIEATDNTEYLESWYGEDEGNLYEGQYGSDLEDGWITSYDQDNGVDVGFTDLQTLKEALDAMVTPDTFLTDADAVIDMSRYVQFAATEIFLGHWDGYAWTRNNYFLYHGPDGRWTFMPWGIDQTFWDYLPIWGGDGRVEEMCGQSLPCRQALEGAFTDVIDRVDTLQLVTYADVLLALIDQAMQEDPRKEVDAGTVYWAIDMTQEFLLNRPADVQAQFICTDPAALDDDGDGSSGCGWDCNDGDIDVYPGAPEVCNFQDDDCNGQLDDDPMCPQCVTTPSPSGGTLAYCFQNRTYLDAEADCVAQGGHLVSIHDQATQDEVQAGAFGRGGGDWWIGADDLAQEGQFEWTDGTPFDYTAWADGEPNNWGEVENCAHLWSWSGGPWNDLDCNSSIYYVCRLP